MSQFEELNARIVSCTRCPRLLAHCRSVAETKRAAYRDEIYWGKPVPNFGDSNARVLVVGLAPAAHGGNRTGRMFTGDRSGESLFRALHGTGLASQSDSRRVGDGLALRGALITAVGHCAPPENKLRTEEIASCRVHLSNTLECLANLRVIVALGKVAYDQCAKHLRARGLARRPPPFAHGARVDAGRHALLGCYHPSQQNTFTGKLTEEMLRNVFEQARRAAYGDEQPGGGSPFTK